MLTVGQLKEDPRVQSAIGRDSTDPAFLKYLDSAVRRLMQMADWDDAIQDYCFSVCDKCIYVPPEIKTILGVQIDRVPAKLFNRVFTYIPNGPGNWHPASRSLIDRGNQQVFISQPGCPCGLVVLSDECEDADTHVRVQALDSANRPIIGSTGFPYLEFDLTQQGHIHETRNISKIVQVTKTVTRGAVYVYLLDPILEQPAELVAHILPWQTSAEYRMYEVGGAYIGGEGVEVRLHARRRHTTLYHSDQAVLIDSVDAIVAAIRYQAALDGRDPEGAQLFRMEIENNLIELSRSENYRKERRFEFNQTMRLGGGRKMGR